MFGLTWAIASLLPTSTIANWFEFTPQMKALGSIAAVKHPFTTTKFNARVFP